MNEQLYIVKKREIRKEIIKRLADQDPALAKQRSKRIQEALLSSEEFQVARTVMTYVSLPTEVDTRYLNKEALKRGKRVAVPYIKGSQTIIASELTALECLEKGPFGIYQPKEGLNKIVASEEIDLIIVPAIAYDKENMRLGRGKGYYDKFLAKGKLSLSKTIGLAFHFQIVDCLPVGPHDRPVYRVITD